MNAKTRTGLVLVIVIVMLVTSTTVASAQRVCEDFLQVTVHLEEARITLLDNGNLNGAAQIQEQINAWIVRYCGECGC
jgi:hypothetical protein